ncbi:hypothetical protein [Amycolatopsis benzoatilytica]|uniref:hypothetical protein n=1 Tax=Amycolatopsis benzoatilytica TaxID=346045 RepID=UPI0012B68863|nr:hypothetical protein [Amycolatopsis benzoatilytica]
MINYTGQSGNERPRIRDDFARLPVTGGLCSYRNTSARAATIFSEEITEIS